MRRMIFVYGGIAGFIVFVSFLLSSALNADERSLRVAELLGYLVMIVALSMIFLGIKRYRDEVLGGVIKFGTAFKLGLGITLVASVIYVAGWEVNLLINDYDFVGEYTERLIEEKKAEGISEAELRAEVAKMEEMKAMYANPLYRLPWTFIEIFPVGLLITLLSSLLLRNSRFLAVA